MLAHDKRDEMLSGGGAVSGAVREMFAKIAARYDHANSVLSCGMHHGWRRRMAQLALLQPGMRVLDCATGTGDLAFTVARALIAVGDELADGQVIGTDFTPKMIELARAKATRLKLPVVFRQADVMHLPFADDEFDAASIAFGIRNVDDPVAGLREMARVVKPGGKVLVLEFGQPKGSIIAPLFRFYSRHIIPVLGGIITGRSTAYRYLNETSFAFPCGDDFIALLADTGAFATTDYCLLSGGIAYAYCCVVGE